MTPLIASFELFFFFSRFANNSADKREIENEGEVGKDGEFSNQARWDMNLSVARMIFEWHRISLRARSIFSDEKSGPSLFLPPSLYHGRSNKNSPVRVFDPFRLTIKQFARHITAREIKFLVVCSLITLNMKRHTVRLQLYRARVEATRGERNRERKGKRKREERRKDKERERERVRRARAVYTFSTESCSRL